MLNFIIQKEKFKSWENILYHQFGKNSNTGQSQVLIMTRGKIPLWQKVKKN